MGTALPSQVVSQGPWATEEDWSRDPKGIGESIPSPTSLLGRLGNWWTWDRDVVKEGIFKNENIMIHAGQVHSQPDLQPHRRGQPYHRSPAARTHHHRGRRRGSQRHPGVRGQE